MEIVELSDKEVESYLNLLNQEDSVKDLFSRLGFPLSKQEYYEKIKSFSTWIKAYVAKQNGEVIGAVTFTGADNLNMEDACIITDVSVRRDQRNKGIGMALVNTVLNFAKTQGIRKVVTIVSEMNVPALEMFRKIGFKPYRVLKDYYIQGENAVALEYNLT
ncbi:MAG: GNAT family N-acetyltransferase [Thermoprotei archaeon]